MKIKELQTNDLVDITLVVVSAVARETKSKKPYLAMELYDGTDRINANYWDWAGKNIPPVNAILDINAQVTEWQGIKQLNVKMMKTCTTRTIADFMPTSDYDVANTYKSAYTLLSDVEDDTLRTLALAILEELREYWITVPGAVSVHHNFVGGTLVHSYMVALKAKAMAQVTAGANVDIATVGGFLHDIGKLFTYRVNGVNIDMTANGKLYEHIFMGAEFVGNFAESHVDVEDPYIYGKVRMLRHIILSHHGKLEYGSPVTPQCIEAYIVHYADALDATSEQLRVASNGAPSGSIWTDRLWPLNNKQHLTYSYTSSLMAGDQSSYKEET